MGRDVEAALQAGCRGGARTASNAEGAADCGAGGGEEGSVGGKGAGVVAGLDLPGEDVHGFFGVAVDEGVAFADEFEIFRFPAADDGGVVYRDCQVFVSAFGFYQRRIGIDFVREGLGIYLDGGDVASEHGGPDAFADGEAAVAGPEALGIQLVAARFGLAAAEMLIEGVAHARRRCLEGESAQV